MVDDCDDCDELDDIAYLLFGIWTGQPNPYWPGPWTLMIWPDVSSVMGCLPQNDGLRTAAGIPRLRNDLTLWPGRFLILTRDRT